MILKPRLFFQCFPIKISARAFAPKKQV
jgi:hypothetical protein